MDCGICAFQAEGVLPQSGTVICYIVPLLMHLELLKLLFKVNVFTGFTVHYCVIDLLLPHKICYSCSDQRSALAQSIHSSYLFPHLISIVMKGAVFPLTLLLLLFLGSPSATTASGSSRIIVHIQLCCSPCVLTGWKKLSLHILANLLFLQHSNPKQNYTLSSPFCTIHVPTQRTCSAFCKSVGWPRTTYWFVWTFSQWQ